MSIYDLCSNLRRVCFYIYIYNICYIYIFVHTFPAVLVLILYDTSNTNTYRRVLMVTKLNSVVLNCAAEIGGLFP